MTTQTPVPESAWDRSQQYEQAQVGDTLHYHDGWKWHQGTVTWLDSWREGTFGDRERLAVIALVDGGLALVALYRTPAEPWHEGRDFYDARDTGMRSGAAFTADDIGQFLDTVRGRLAAEEALDQSINDSVHGDKRLR